MKKRYLKNFSILIAFGLVSLVSSCITDAESIDGKGPKMIRVDAGKDQLVVAETVTSTVTFAKIWRDATDKKSLNESLTISFSADPQIVLDHNAHNKPNEVDYLPMDEAYYTVEPTTVEFLPGEFVKTVTVTMSAAGLDLSNDYAVGLVVNTPSGWQQAGHRFIALALPSAYAGEYVSTGARYNYTVVGDANTTDWPPSGWVSSATWSFDPTTANTLSSKTIAVHAANDNGGFGRINLTVNSDNTVTIVPNADIELNELKQSTHRPSTYDPVTKTFELYYEYTNPSGTFRNLYHRLVKK